MQDPLRFLDSIGDRVLREDLSPTELESLLNLLLAFSAVENGRNRCSELGRGAQQGMTHEYIVRETGEIARERLVGDRTVRALYSPKLENAAWVSKLASSRRVSEVLGYLNYDNRLSSRAVGHETVSEKERH